MATQPALFRQEAIDFLHQRHSWGEVVSLQPISSTILSWSLASLVAFILCFLSIAQYARKETVTGYLTPTFGTAKIFVPQQGFIKELQVKDGQEVAEGDPLLTVVTSQITADGHDVNATVLAALTQQRDVTKRIRGLRGDLSGIEQRVAEVNGRRAYVIKAPTSGRVSTLQATVGQIADPRHMQLEIIPLDATLQAELFFPTRAFGFVRPGQQVRVLYDAFPYQKFGTYRGRW